LEKKGADAEDDIEVNHRKTGCEDVVRIELAQDRKWGHSVVKMVSGLSDLRAVIAQSV
jgi:hypothetical protein